jgi:hypothetical protein
MFIHRKLILQNKVQSSTASKTKMLNCKGVNLLRKPQFANKTFSFLMTVCLAVSNVIAKRISIEDNIHVILHFLSVSHPSN